MRIRKYNIEPFLTRYFVVQLFKRFVFSRSFLQAEELLLVMKGSALDESLFAKTSARKSFLSF